jgi:transposase
METLPFSEVNFLMLLALVNTQREEINTQREEINTQREEINVQRDEIKTQGEEIAYLKSRINELEVSLKQDSHNSSKPPSSDGYKKRIHNSREKSGKKPGGQPGRKGVTLEMTSTPDEVIIHKPSDTCTCGCGLNDWEELPVEVGQVIDIPKPKVKITEHRKTGFKCKACGDAFTGELPPEACVDRIQYGPNIQSVSVYLNQYHLIPYQRLVEVFQDLCGTKISVGTLVNFTKRTHIPLESIESTIREKLLSEPVLHSDETGIRCNGKTQWIHTASTEKHTVLHMDEKRGVEAMEKMGLLPKYTGCVIHDRLSSYFKFDHLKHGLCNAHVLRELTSLVEQGYPWAALMIALLLRAKKYKEENTSVRPAYITRVKNEYTQLVALELKKEEILHQASRRSVCRGRPKRSKAHNLLLALQNHQEKFLLFLMHAHVPFDNNQAERDLRMVKTKQKVSGCFRSLEGGAMFCRIRGYISTLIKNEINVLEGIQDAIAGKPFILALEGAE